MTNEEAIKILKEIEYPVNGDNKKCRDTALDMAIKALEQKDVLNKIRAEIEQIIDTIGVYNQYVSKIDVLAILDRYRTESEDKE